MKPTKEQIEAYNAMASESAGDMISKIKENLVQTCDKYKGNEDKFEKCFAYLTECAKEILDNKSGAIPDDVCYRICRDYFNDELWKKEEEEKAKKELEAAKHKTAKKAEKAEKKTVFKSTPTPPNSIIEAVKRVEEKLDEKTEDSAPSNLQLDLFAGAF